MTENLDRIQKRFNKASQSYDGVACVQKNAAQFLVSQLLKNQDFAPRAVLDVGTGTGYIPELLSHKYPQCSFYLNDIAGEMLEVCKTKFAKNTHIDYLHGNMLDLNAHLYDCVISNLALQWLPDLRHAIHFLYSKSSDVFAFSTLLDGTFAEWIAVIGRYQSPQILAYPKAHDLIDVCQKMKKNGQGFSYWLMDQSLTFANHHSFMRYLQSLGASTPAHPVNLFNLKKILQEETQGLTVTYKLFFGIFRSMDE